MENEMETRGIQAFKALNLSYYLGKTLLFTVCTHYGNLIFRFLNSNPVIPSEVTPT